jgi:transcription termination factor Rho
VFTLQLTLTSPAPAENLQKIWVLRKLLADMDDIEAMNFIVDKLKSTKNNGEFFDLMRKGG